MALNDAHDGFHRELENTTDQGRNEYLEREIQKATDQIEDTEATLNALRGQLRSQIAAIRETVQKILNEDTTLPEHIRTLFHEECITLVSIITAIGMVISTLVVALTGSRGRSTPTPPTPLDKGAKEWIKQHLKALASALAKFAGKAGAALPGIIGSNCSWLLSLLSKKAGWLASNLWALVVGVTGLVVLVFRKHFSK